MTSAAVGASAVVVHAEDEVVPRAFRQSGCPLVLEVLVKSVLISGAGVAGVSLAYFLSAAGMKPTIVERAEDLRPGGQAVDVRGAALLVIERMGLSDRVLESRTRVAGLSVLDASGEEIHRSEERTLSAGRMNSGDVELFRDDLVRLLHDATRAKCEWLFGDEVAGLYDDEGAAHVTFASGAKRSFDLVVGADGVWSGVRRIAFGPDLDHLRHLGAHLAIFSTPNVVGLKNWQVAYQGEVEGFLIYPTRDNSELRVFLGFATVRADLGPMSAIQRKRLVADRCAGMDWRIPDLLRFLPDSDLYFGPMAQIHMPTWARGRIGLVGDAAYCASPKSGQGTSMALVGAFVLAQELTRTDDHPTAFLNYQRRMRPFVEANQALATENPVGPPADASVEAAKWAIDLDQILPTKAGDTGIADAR